MSDRRPGRPGRPPLAAEERRTHTVAIRVTARELARWRSKAADRTISAWLRRLADDDD